LPPLFFFFFYIFLTFHITFLYLFRFSFGVRSKSRCILRLSVFQTEALRTVISSSCYVQHHVAFAWLPTSNNRISNTSAAISELLFLFLPLGPSVRCLDGTEAIARRAHPSLWLL
ncbi:hypothetical protein Tcan_01188, partial [Toxocara canis]